MKRYHYNPVSSEPQPARKWLIPVGLVGGAAIFLAMATVGVSRTADQDPEDNVGGGAVSAKAQSAAAALETPASGAAERMGVGQRQTVQKTFGHCGTIRRTCVVDGDTIWLEGVKIRVADIDTPEISQPKCASEKALGDRATERLIVLLNEGPFELFTIGNRDEDRYGRKLRVIVRDGQSIGDQLVAEGLARTWTGRREPWC